MLLLYSYRTSPPMRDLLVQDRDRGHVHVMSAFPRVSGDAPRSSMGVLWHIEPGRRILTVQARVQPTHTGLLGDLLSVDELSLPVSGEEREIKVLLACQKTPPSKVPQSLRSDLKARADGLGPGATRPPGEGRTYRSRPVVVPEDERVPWLLRTFARHGLLLQEKTVEISALHHANLGKRGRGIPAVDVTARGIVEQAAESTRALQVGIGKGRTYGLGLLRTRTI